MRTLEEALEKFDLVQSSAGDGERTACETSLLNWVSGEDTWSDAFSCASPLIRSLMIGHNDDPETTKEQRVEAVKLGMAGAIDTWWIPEAVVLSYYGDFKREETPTRHERLVKMLTGVAAWKENKVRPNLIRANLDGARNLGSTLYLNKASGEPASLPDGWEFKNGLIVKKAS